uniref:Uncharacterized protein n=1 Tax=Rhizophora mucronata TaxID=61149 RepID=A0A2P2QP89_RHIMU
MSLQITKQAIN